MDTKAFLAQWASPAGISQIVQLVLVLMSGVTALLAILGHKQASEEVQTQKNKFEAETVKSKNFQEQVANASKVVAGIVQGVEAFRNADSTPDEHAEALKRSIIDVTTSLGIEHMVQPLVKAVTEGKGSISTALAGPANPPVAATAQP